MGIKAEVEDHFTVTVKGKKGAHNHEKRRVEQQAQIFDGGSSDYDFSTKVYGLWNYHRGYGYEVQKTYSEIADPGEEVTVTIQAEKSLSTDTYTVKVDDSGNF